MPPRETARMDELENALADMIEQGVQVPAGALPAAATGSHPDLAAHETLGLADAAHNHDVAYSASGHGHAGYSATGHSHAESDVTNLGSDLAGKAPSSHNHDASYAGSAHAHDAAYAVIGHTHPGGGSAPQFPVNHILLSADNTNPATWLGYGTWVQVGQGRFIVGQDPNDTDFSSAGNTSVGAKTHGHTFTPPADHAALSHSGLAVADHAAGTSGANSGTAVKIGTSGNSAAPSGHTHPTPALVHSVTPTSDHAAMSHSGASVASGSSLPPGFVAYLFQRTA